ncbi:MAG TPA: nucleotidyltransferase substrate binding protein [Rectinemataceae bacterium]|nr:nucleotidyltransferase substrate binding protein [Rectinemataceae bacterium]
MEERLRLILAELESAIADFEGALSIEDRGLDPIVVDAVHNGQAQKFEFTTELFWKAVKVFLYSEHGFDLSSPKNVVKKYFELGYVDYEKCDRLLRALDIRNSLSHVYNKSHFVALYEEIRGFGGFFGKVAEGMRSR